MKNRRQLLFLIAVGVAVLIMYKSRKSGGGGGKADFTVYGTAWCGYTTKQREALGGRHTYIDCDLDKAQCQGINGFPVTVNNTTGERHKGFNPNL
jgi:hypothetical protein